jgi:membrane protease YdiL (CAAX protease family)
MTNPALRRALPGVLTAIAITTAMDANGLADFSALPLFPLMALFWYLERLSRQDMGFRWGKRNHYGLALLYPLAVLGVTALVSFMAGVIDLTQTDWDKALRNLALVSVMTVLVAILTEEGFFRGWLFGSLHRAAASPAQILLWSSIAFAAWHVSAGALDTGFDVPAKQIPVYLVNAAVIGAVWGMLRLMSGSVIVASVSHGVWNGGAYVFFGYGSKVGALGIANTAVYGPEVGVVGLVLNIIFAVALWRRWKQAIT